MLASSSTDCRLNRFMLWGSRRRSRSPSLSIRIEIGFVFGLVIDSTIILSTWSKTIKLWLSIKPFKYPFRPKRKEARLWLEKINSKCPSSISAVFVITKNWPAYPSKTKSWKGISCRWCAKLWSWKSMKAELCSKIELRWFARKGVLRRWLLLVNLS